MLRNKLWVIFLIPAFLSTMLKSTDVKYQQQEYKPVEDSTATYDAGTEQETSPADSDFPIYIDISGLTKSHLYKDGQLNIPRIDDPDEVQQEPETEIEEVDEEPGGLVSLGYFVLTAYCSCPECCGEYAYSRPLDDYGNPIVYTASGAVASAGTTIAVDPSVIPYGTSVIIDGHTYIAQDTGGAIVGNRIDVYFDNHEDAWNFGYQEAEVFVDYGS